MHAEGGLGVRAGEAWGCPAGCPPAFDPEDSSTYTGWGRTPKRPEGYCRHARGSAADTTQHYTMVFNVFVLMQVCAPAREAEKRARVGGVGFRVWR